MTVRELIRELTDCEPDLEVLAIDAKPPYDAIYMVVGVQQENTLVSGLIEPTACIGIVRRGGSR